MNTKNKSNISRRDFLRRLGLGGVAAAVAAVPGCKKAAEKGNEAIAGPLGPIPTDKMTHRVNPTTGDSVSLLGYGCMRWPTKRVDGQDVLDQDEINRLVDKALEHGVNYFDTSPAYCQGKSEEATGIALSRHPRDSYYIATKLSNFSPSTWSRETSLAMYHDSFKKLQTDHIDYLLLHSVGQGGLDQFNARYINNGVLDYLMAEREAGRIRNLGFSYHGDINVFDWLVANHDKYRWDFVQIQLNYLDWKRPGEGHNRSTDANYLYTELEKRGIPVVIMEPLLGGRLSSMPDHVVAHLKQREPQRSVASWAFRYAGTHPGVLTVLSGMTYMDHLEDNLRSFCPLVPLTEQEQEYLYDTADMLRKYPTIPCNDCKYCMPCPYGIDIPAVLLHYNKCVNEGNVAQANDPEYAKARRAYLVGYDRSVPKLRQASHCIGCNTCKSHCPQQIDIPRQLHRIDAYVESLKRNPA